MDLTTLAVLSMFGAFVAGGLLGVLVGKVTRFEVGLGVGLLVPGIVCLWFAAQCLLEYRAFQYAGANGVWGEVVGIEQRAVNAAGDILQPVPVIRFAAPDASVHTIHGPGSGSMTIGEAVNVIYDPADPARSRVGQLTELRGGAIAMMLFGTFPTTLGLWFLYAYARKGVSQPQRKTPRAQGQASGVRTGPPHKRVLAAFYCTVLGGMLWIAMGTSELGLRFAHGFGVIALALFGYAIWGAASRVADTIWATGVFTLGINFGAWAFAMYLLFA